MPEKFLLTGLLSFVLWIFVVQFIKPIHYDDFSIAELIMGCWLITNLLVIPISAFLYIWF